MIKITVPNEMREDIRERGDQYKKVVLAARMLRNLSMVYNSGLQKYNDKRRLPSERELFMEAMDLARRIDPGMFSARYREMMHARIEPHLEGKDGEGAGIMDYATSMHILELMDLALEMVTGWYAWMTPERLLMVAASQQKRYERVRAELTPGEEAIRDAGTPLRIIALNGPKGSGKSTAAGIISRALGYKEIAFADALRDAAAAAYGMPREEFRELSTNHATKELPCARLGGRTPRQVLIDMGLYFCRIDPMHWARLGVAAAQEALIAGAPGVVISDCRYLNEAALLRQVFPAGDVAVIGIIRAAAEINVSESEEHMIHDRYEICDALIENREVEPSHSLKDMDIESLAAEELAERIAEVIASPDAARRAVIEREYLEREARKEAARQAREAATEEVYVSGAEEEARAEEARDHFRDELEAYYRKRKAEALASEDESDAAVEGCAEQDARGGEG